MAVAERSADVAEEDILRADLYDLLGTLLARPPSTETAASRILQIDHTELPFPNYIKNQEAMRWIQQAVTLCKPDRIHFCDGSQAEYDRQMAELPEGQIGTDYNVNQNLPGTGSTGEGDH